VVDSIHDAAGTNKHTAENKLLDGIGVGTGGIEHRDTKFSHTSNGDVVHTRSTASDGPAGLRNVLLLELVRTKEDGVGVGTLDAIGADVVLFVAGQSLEALEADLIEALDLVLAGLYRDNKEVNERGEISVGCQ
jgi:hypothetical protein